MLIHLFVILLTFTLLICYIYCSYFIITDPGTVSNIVAVGTTTTMSVTWKAASGQVDYYSVVLTGAGQMPKSQSHLSNTTLHVLFEKLNPGTLYHISVCAISGPGSECLATDNATCEFIYSIFDISY